MNNNTFGHLHPRAYQGILLFNQKKFFQAHDELEFAWRETKDPIRELYRGILQVGVSYYHLENNNIRGAKIMLQRAQKWLKLFPDVCQGIDVKKLKNDADKIYLLILDIEQGKIIKISPLVFQPINFQK